jgi:hypothetical protein
LRPPFGTGRAAETLASTIGLGTMVEHHEAFEAATTDFITARDAFLAATAKLAGVRLAD